VNAGGSSFSITDSLATEDYLIVARDSVRFEEVWGDSSGIWGDGPTENYRLIQRSFQLTNTGGSVILSKLAGEVSRLAWTEAGADGVSWERTAPDSVRIAPSLDPTGATPGRMNSHAPVAVDLAVETVEPELISGITVLTFTVVNRGLTDVTGAAFTLYYRTGGDLGEVLLSGLLDEITVAETLLVETQHSFIGETYVDLAAVLDDDDRTDNNRIDFTAPGAAFPPLRLSEVLVNPTGALNSEWIELKNVGTEPLDLRGWRFGDSLTLVAITPETVLVPPDSYVVLTQNELVFRGFYGEFEGLLVIPSSWPALNNNGDVVRLADSFGLEADRFAYATGFDNNHTWGSSESGSTAGRWGRSEDPGGTPGEANLVRLSTEGENSLTVSIEPQIISPDGDGVDDWTEIAIRAPEASAYTLRLYDSRGRLVKTFERDASDLAENYRWDGRDDGGGRLPIGLYILYFDATGVQTIKKSIVVAR